MAWTPLRDHGVIVRPWRQDDFVAFTALQDDSDVRRWSPAFERKSPQQLLSALAHEAEVGPLGGPGAYAVTAATGQVVGEVSFRFDLPSPPFSIADVGYCVLPEGRGRGVAGTALRLLAQWLLDPGGRDLTRVQLDHAVENIGSCRTAARAGFVHEGVRAGYLPLRADADSPVVLHATCLHGVVR